MSGIVRIPLVVSDRNPTDTTLSDKGNFVAHGTRKAKKEIGFS